jgi:hypothetical protein
VAVATLITATAGMPSSARSLWNRLARPSRPGPPFDPAQAAALPEPARRFLCRALRTGTPRPRAVLVEQTGRIKLGAWLPFRASQILAPPEGLVWSARAGWGPLTVRGYDRYGDGVGEMHWRLGGVVPVVRASGADIDLSAAGRLAAEVLLVPSLLLEPWISVGAGSGADRFTMVAAIDRWQIFSEVVIGADDLPARITTARWGHPADEPWGEYPFTVEFEGAVETGAGITLPQRLTAGWFGGTDRWERSRFFTARLTSATFL